MKWEVRYKRNRIIGEQTMLREKFLFETKTEEERRIEVENKMEFITSVLKEKENMRPIVYRQVVEILSEKRDENVLQIGQILTKPEVQALVLNDYGTSILSKLVRYSLQRGVLELGIYGNVENIDKLCRVYQMLYIELTKLEITHMKAKVERILLILQNYEMTVDYLFFVLAEAEFYNTWDVATRLANGLLDIGAIEEARLLVEYMKNAMGE